MPNPFDGSGQTPVGTTVPVYSHDKETGILWQLGPSGYDWINLGWHPPANMAPPVPPPPPPIISSEFTDDPIVHASATQYAKDAVNYNKGVFIRAASKLEAWQTQHKGEKPKSPISFYRISDYNTLVMIIAAGLAGEREGKPPAPVPMPPEYN